MKKWMALCLCFAMCFSILACGSDENAVFVQKVGDLAAMGAIAPGDRFPGIVVSENTTEIKKDSEMTVAELLVREGDDVQAGQQLFSYDTQQMQLSLDKQRLELEQLDAAIESYEDQITELEDERSEADEDDWLEYTVQIQSLELDLKEAKINRKAKESAVSQSEALMENAVVTSPVDGRIQSISENGYDNYGNPLPYITIQQTGAYRVKGTIGELQRGAIMEGTRMQILSRTDGSTWSGTVTLVDYENPSQGDANSMYYGAVVDEMGNSSKYPFYVELDGTKNLVLGQHVYLQLENQTEEVQGLSISSAFFAYTDFGEPYVWADNNGKLEKRTVTLGEYDPMNDTFPVLSGIAEEDYIAFPDMELCVEGAATTKTEPAQEKTVLQTTPESGVY